jgi:hypothetical protein
MIEASYPGGEVKEELKGLVAESDSDTESTEFDWSPTAVVSESVAAPAPTFEPKFVFDESSEESIETVAETPQFERILDDDDLGLDALIGRSSAEPVEQTEEVAVGAMTEDVAEEPPTEPIVEDVESEAAEPEIWPEVESGLGGQREPQPPAITAEMLDIIADKVVARLSDHVVREVALDAVPRIAEKLIREALSDTGRSNENKEAKETSA